MDLVSLDGLYIYSNSGEVFARHECILLDIAYKPSHPPAKGYCRCCSLCLHTNCCGFIFLTWSSSVTLQFIFCRVKDLVPIVQDIARPWFVRGAHGKQIEHCKTSLAHC